MHEDLASIREVVSLSAREILDSAESLVSRLGYDTTRRIDYFLRAPPWKAPGKTCILCLSRPRLRRQAECG
jgi:hypothetical protein